LPRASTAAHPDARPTAFVEPAPPPPLWRTRIAEGGLDVYPRLGPTSEWDTAAGQCVLHAAGGAVLSAATGKPFRYNRRETLLNGDFIALGDTSLPWRDWLSD
jgi:3'(2'), 5'-bisphosphate nucleotidase